MKDLIIFLLTFTKQFSCISYNVGGLNHSVKCDKILNKFVYPYGQNSLGIVCFQELKFNCDSMSKLAKKLPSYFSFMSTNVNTIALEGVSLSIHKSLNPVILDKKVEKGWLILVKCRIFDNVCVIGNVYMPSAATVPVYCDRLKIIEKHLQYFKCDNVILQGDFNVDLEHTSSVKQKVLDLEHILDKWELQDVWRLQNPTSNRCTHFHNSQHSRRLDYCFVSLNFMCHVSKCTIGNAAALIIRQFCLILHSNRREGRSLLFFQSIFVIVVNSNYNYLKT